MNRRDPITTGEYYHVFNKSIAGYKIFQDKEHYSRIKQMMKYYQFTGWSLPFSHFIRLPELEIEGFWNGFPIFSTHREKQAEIVAYCIMPTHVHFLLRQLKENGIERFVRNLLNSYSHYFNLRHHRLGPLWQGRSRSVLVESDEQLLHLTRYIHLNPVTANLVERPEMWEASSYEEYLQDPFIEEQCISSPPLDRLDPSMDYRKFVEDGIIYQIERAKSVTH